MDADGKRANGLLYIDRNTRQPKEIYGRVVALCAQSQESVRILLNSSTRQYPNGLANSSGALGHYLMDHLWVAAGASAEFPELGDKPSLNGPNRPDGIYVIRFRNTERGPRSKKFLRGYGYQGRGGANFNLAATGFGEAYKKAVTDPNITVKISSFGECLARWDNYVEIDPNVVDTYGIPALRIHMSFGDNEHAMIPDMAEAAVQMMEAAGGRNIQPFTVPDRQPGYGIHEVGIARMGDNPRKSVLNQFQQCHDIPNLLVLDGSGFTSSACQNPTLTIMALCVRSCDNLMQEMKRGNV